MSHRSCSHYICVSTIKHKANRAASKSSLLPIVILTLSVLFSGQAWATIRWVDAAATSGPPGTGCGTSAGYKTIGAAIADSTPGDTIKVCPGLYAEQVNIDKTLTLLGAQSGVDARTRL